MKCAVKILIVAFLFTVALSSDCAAKIISDSSGRYSFETSDAWKFINAGTSSTDNIELLSIRLDKDTGILFNQLKTNVNYKNISEMSAEDKNKLKDALVQYNLEEFSEYSTSAFVTLIKADTDAYRKMLAEQAKEKAAESE